MSNQSINIFPMSYLDFEAFPNSTIFLSPDDIYQAAELSDKITNKFKQWQIYLNALALSAFEQWITERAESLTINRKKCSILQPDLATFLNCITNLNVGEFKVCLIATGTLDAKIINLPRIVVDLPEFVPHFYVLVEVLEEKGAANIYAFLSYQELVERLNIDSSHVNYLQSDWTYQLPISCFDDDSDHLLLYLRCLQPQAISLPAIPTNRDAILSTVEHQLVELLPQLQSPRQELYEVLTWEQATAVFTNSELLNWLYTFQKENIDKANIGISNFLSQKNHLRDLIQLITQPALNAGCWLYDELDELAQRLCWVLLPSFTTTSAIRPMRSPEEEFEMIVKQIQQRGLEIPAEGRGAYHDLRLAGIPLRLYAVTWHVVSNSQNTEWSLMLILGAPALSRLQHNVKLRVSDQTGILVEQELDTQSSDSYIFTRVVGNWDEKFLVRVSLMDGVEVTLPPFTFDLGRQI